MKPRPIKIEVPARLRPYLADLATTGLYGSTAEEVAQTLILDQLKDLIGRGILKVRTLV